MSLQAQPQQQQPPVQVYPDPVTNHPSPPPSHHHYSNGSFGTVFIVLAIILVISTVACFLGRLCNRRRHNNNNHRDNHHNLRSVGRVPRHQPQQIHNFHPREGDIEFGVDKRFPPTIGGRPKGPVILHGGAAGTGGEPHLQPPHNMRDFEMKPADHDGGELRAGA